MANKTQEAPKADEVKAQAESIVVLSNEEIVTPAGFTIVRH